MKILNWNVRGLGNKKKLRVIKEVLVSCGANVIDRSIVGSIWVSNFKDWDFLPSCGSSSGILLMWNTKIFSVKEFVAGNYSGSVDLVEPDGRDWWILAVYGPNNPRDRRAFWEELVALSALCGSRWCIEGDFNVARYLSEKSNGGKVTRSMRVFNEFIGESNLCDPELLNAEFTWSNMRERVIQHRLDRFLFTPQWEELFPNVR